MRSRRSIASWLDSPARRMTLARPARRGRDRAARARSSARCEPLRLRVDDQGFTRIDEAKGRPGDGLLRAEAGRFA